eukprot:3288332-Rhodomonas_salina.4
MRQQRRLLHLRVPPRCTDTLRLNPHLNSIPFTYRCRQVRGTELAYGAPRVCGRRGGVQGAVRRGRRSVLPESHPRKPTQHHKTREKNVSPYSSNDAGTDVAVVVLQPTSVTCSPTARTRLAPAPK